jgi:uncharacterized membrane protein HdeD (DUF308 family)
MRNSSTAAPGSTPLRERLTRFGGSPVVVVTEGAVSALFGVLVLAWPGPTVTVLATLFAVQLLATGMLQLGTASSRPARAGDRVLSCLLATWSLLIGLLCLRTPLQTTLLLGLLIGLMWVLGGALRLAQATVAAPGAPRGWRFASGGLWVIAGALVLETPDVGLIGMATVLGVVLVLQGAFLVAGGLTVRRAGGSAQPDADPPPVRLTDVPPVRPRAPL